jgi:hypothetical protein
MGKSECYWRSLPPSINKFIVWVMIGRWKIIRETVRFDIKQFPKQSAWPVTYGEIIKAAREKHIVYLWTATEKNNCDSGWRTCQYFIEPAMLLGERRRCATLCFSWERSPSKISKNKRKKSNRCIHGHGGSKNFSYPTVFTALSPLMHTYLRTSGGFAKDCFAFYERQNRRLTLGTCLDSTLEHLFSSLWPLFILPIRFIKLVDDHSIATLFRVENRYLHLNRYFLKKKKNVQQKYKQKKKQ